MFRRLREDIAMVLERDPAARSTFEVLTLYPGVHALAWHRLAHRLWLANFKWTGRWVSQLARFLTGIEIHPGAIMGRRVFIDHGMGVVIGETADVGDDCTIYQGVTLGGTTLHKGKRHPTLGRNVTVGAGAKILGPFTVGDGAAIGSNAVVVREVPAGATVVGIPGRVITRPDDTALHFGEKREFVPYGVYDVEERVEPSLAATYTPPLYIEPEMDIALPKPIVPKRDNEPPVEGGHDADIDSLLNQINELEEKLGEQHAANEMKKVKAGSAADETAGKISSLNR